ncbi:leucine-rich alpha-2-glycoprotein-like [Sinocyclocheilus rhinocerous]|uniref:leucine-rich alpha-2-glycoprotein-like n=1 Tax=Sinocyclocheilus rhinocerous TaxID=307959 RepID=UPI0007BAC0B1|nr:PREDICTED: leucine-rich alpha-2-glycoprotein-like [Sinocyclocheilus rhinocerous]
MTVVFCCRDALSCPMRCTCHFSAKTTEVVCPDADLSSFPGDGLPGNTTSLTIQFTNLNLHLTAIPLLEELHLPGNKLSSSPADLLKGLHYLHTIDLTDNELQEIPAYVFHHAPLLNLVLKDNRISSIHPDWLPNNSNITWLDLSGNHLMKFPMAQLQSLSHLKVLHLSQNKLKELPVGCLVAHPAQERFNVDQNKIQSLDVKSFCCSGNLTHIFLQKTRLDSLPPTVFQGLKRLDYVDLSDNRLQFLPTGTLDINTSWVELIFNPWHCYAKIEYLWRKLTMESLQSEPKCTAPENLKDRVIATLTRKEMGLPD